MRTTPCHPSWQNAKPVRTTCPLAAGLCALLMLLSSSHADAQTPASDKSESTLEASRFIKPDSLKDYISTVSGIMIIKNRPYDPFGQAQDPDAKAAPTEPTPGTIRRHTPIKPTSFSEIVRGIQVNAIMPNENRFLIGTRSFKVGDVIPITFRGRAMKIKVVAVNANKIEYMDVENKDTASVPLNLLPAGMSAGTNGILSAPGMQPDNNDTPIEIEATSSAP